MNTDRISIKFVAFVLAGAMVAAGCSQTVRITTEPEGADVYVNNIYVGSTPTNWRTRSGVPDTAYVKIEKPGYETVNNATIEKSYRADVQLLWLIAAIVPYFVVTARYEDDYIFHLKKK